MSLSEPITKKRLREKDESSKQNPVKRLKTSAGKIFADKKFLEIFQNLFFPDESLDKCAQRIIDSTARNPWNLYVSVQSYMLDVGKYPSFSDIFVMLMTSYMEYIFKYQQSNKVSCVFNGEELDVQLTGSAIEGNVLVFFAGIFRLKIIKKDGSLHYDATLRKNLRLKIDDDGTVSFVVVSEDDTANSANFLGNGVYGDVFEIMGTDDERYVVKVFSDKKSAEDEWAFLEKISGKHKCLQNGLKLMTDQPGYFKDFIISKYQGRVGLHEIKKMKLKIPLQNIIHFFLEMSKGLMVLHDNGFIHGDIKPPNVVFGDDLLFFFLIDFGIATPIGKNQFRPDSLYSWWFRFWGLFLQEKMMKEFNSSNCTIVHPPDVVAPMDWWAFFLTVLNTLSPPSCDFLGFCSMKEDEAREDLYSNSPVIKLMKMLKHLLKEKCGMDFVQKIYTVLFNEQGPAKFIQILNEYKVDSSTGEAMYVDYLEMFKKLREHNPIKRRVEASFSMMRCEDPTVDISGVISELKNLFVEIVCDGGDFSLIGCFTNHNIYVWLCRLKDILNKMNALNKRIFFY